MGERGTLPDVAVGGPITAEELIPLWETWKAGNVYCPRDGGPMALAVDGAAHAYRIVCVKCGAASPWFEAKPAGLHVRTGTSSVPASRHALD
jgi:hypothetical protein